MNVYIPNNHSLLKREDGLIEKIIEPNIRFESGEALRIAKLMIKYTGLLKDLGVPIPQGYRIEIRGDNQIIEHAEDGGYNLQELLTRGGLEAKEAIDLILEALKGVLRQGSNPRVGIDPHPANWCLKNGQLTFVDFFPVYFVKDGEPLAGFPQPKTKEEIESNYQRYYTATGIYRLLRFNMIRIKGPAMEALLKKAFSEKFPRLTFQIFKKISALPVEEIKEEPVTLPQVVKSLTIFNVDDLREITMVIAKDRTIIDEVLRLTTVDFRLSRSKREKRFKKAKSFLLEYYYRRKI